MTASYFFINTYSSRDSSQRTLKVHCAEAAAFYWHRLLAYATGHPLGTNPALFACMLTAFS